MPATATAKKTATATGFKVPCPHCGTLDGLTVRVATLAVECSECSAEVARKDLKRLVDEASRLIRWLDFAKTC